MREWMQRWDVCVKQVEGYLTARFQNQTEPQRVLFEAMQYSLLAGGKRLRPFLLLQFCRACGTQQENALPAAAAVEMIHTYSLIHDDLPCMDNDDYRRGKPTNHKVYGEATAVLAGDALLTEAFSVLCSLQLPPQTVCACVKELSACAGAYGMVGGQVLDMLSEQRVCTAQEVVDIQSRKTGALIRAACRMGVLCGGGTSEQLEAAEKYANAVGLAFQIQDDILDVEGDAAKLGKATGMDANKNTFVRLYGVERCKQMVREQTIAAVQELSAFESPQVLSELAEYLAKRDH